MSLCIRDLGVEMVKEMWDAAQSTTEELQVLMESFELGIGEFRPVPVKTLKKAKDIYKDDWWAELAGVIMRWGDPEIGDAIVHRMMSIEQEMIGRRLSDVRAAYYACPYLIIMPDGTICDCRVMQYAQNTTVIEPRSPYDRHVLVKWGARPPEFDDDRTKYFIRTPWVTLQIHAMVPAQVRQVA